MKYFIVRCSAEVGDYDHWVFDVVKAKNMRIAWGKAKKYNYREDDWKRNSCSCCGDGMPIYRVDEIDEITKAQAEVLNSLRTLEVAYFHY